LLAGFHDGLRESSIMDMEEAAVMEPGVFTYNVLPDISEWQQRHREKIVGRSDEK
jgi:hypothetical protein